MADTELADLLKQFKLPQLESLFLETGKVADKSAFIFLLDRLMKTSQVSIAF